MFALQFKEREPKYNPGAVPIKLFFFANEEFIHFLLLS